ncbi:MAG TPA: DNA topoisomerase 4 subunit A [Candidatus Avichristensenella intestinipullorum]|uniref:DNA topoisomerase (ATP-hydrolyzing) n=1 Tax=Candidatus Avichristensenella intestinipullorum TaxID=2840693 RepID=A0A9D0YWJ3_9FIRM|nr:DNA topoisomerase 4 subunit A [Candidatus Avichristensenella intestinipullorum]
MPKKHGEPVERNEVILEANMEDVMRDAMMPYAEHVILERALPRVEDGLKPVQRRILYTMSELSTTPDKPHRKCARIVGDCLGKFHPHGDTSVYDAMVRMAQPFSMSAPLVDGHGNFGSIDGDSAAAMRYTEARMAPLALEMLRDIDKDTVPFRLNFDDTLKEPDMLPSRFPNLLVNGASGIAVGLATNIPPHNLGEAIDAVCAMIDQPDISTQALMRHLPCPDFPTGGVLLDTPEILAAYETGRGKLTLRARVHIEDGSAGRKLLVITEVPYQVSKAAMLEKILKLSEEKKAALGGIYDIRDESDRTGMRAVVELRRDVNPEAVLATLYKYSDLQVTFGVNMMAIADGKPEQMGLRRVIECFIRHQETVVSRRTRYELDQAESRLHVLDGLIVAVDHLDEIIRIIRRAKNDKEARANLIERFSFSDVQAQAILDLRLRRLTGLEILALREEHAKVCRDIARLKGILASRKKLMDVIKAELTDIRSRYAVSRRTELARGEVLPAVAADDTPEPEEAVVFLTYGGQLRRMHPKWFEKLGEQEEEKDRPRECFRTLSDATLYFFTDRGNCYPLSVAGLPEANRPKERGTLLTGLLAGLEKGERAVRVLCLRPGELEKTADLLFVTANGMVKRTEAAAYAVRKAKFAALSLKPGDALLDVMPLARDSVLLVTALGMVIHFSAAQVPATGRTTAGVRGMSLEEGDRVAYAFLIVPDEGEMLLMSDRGYAKKSLALDFERQNRAGKGLKGFTFQKNGANGSRIAGALYVREPYAFLVRQHVSPPTALSTEDIHIEARAGKGRMYVMALMDDVVTGVERVPSR